MSGWISISRDICKHPLFDGIVYDDLSAWTWLLTSAAWKETRHRVGGKMMVVERGSLFCTLQGLADAWGWKSTQKVRGFLKLLQEEKMIVVDNDTKKTRITICNYSRFQDLTKRNDTEKTRGKHDDDTGMTQPRHDDDTLKEPINQITNTILTGREDEISFEELLDKNDPALITSWLIQTSGIPRDWESIWIVQTGEFYNWVQKGCTEQDIRIGLQDSVSKMKALREQKPHEQMKSWAWSSRFIFEAKAKREAPAPTIEAKPTFQPFEDAVDRRRRKLKEKQQQEAGNVH